VVENTKIEELVEHLLETAEFEKLFQQMMADESDLEERCKQEGWNLEEADSHMIDFTQEFHRLMKLYELPVRNRPELYKALLNRCENLKEESVDDLCWIYCAILCDRGLLLDQYRQERTREQNLLNYLDTKKDMDELLQLLHKRQQLHIENGSLVDKVCREKSIFKPDSKTDKYLVFQEVLQYFDHEGDKQILLDNIEYLLQLANGSAYLKKIKPLFIYQTMLKHRSRICNNSEFKFDMKKLWQYTKYQIETNNDKNYKQYENNIIFFLELCHIFAKDKEIDIELCGWGFAELSNMCEWYYMNYVNEDLDFILPIPMEELVARKTISYFEKGYDAVQLFAANEMEAKEITDFIYTEKPQFTDVIQAIVNYLNEYADELEEQFLKVDQDTDKNAMIQLCVQVFERANAPVKYITPIDLPCIYTTINLLLLQMVEGIAEERLVKAGKKLIGL